MQHKSRIDLLEQWYFGSTIAEKKPDVDFLLTRKRYPKQIRYPNAPTGHSESRDMAPIEILLKHCADQDSNYSENHLAYDVATRKADLRSIIRRLLQALSGEDLGKLLNSRLLTGSTVKGALARLDLLPEVFQESTKLWQENIPFDLGAMSVLPPEILHPIFKTLNINEARRIAHVSKSWFKELTSHEIWHEKSKSSNPYLALLKKEFYAKYMQRKRIHFEDVEIVNGEGLLGYEEGLEHSLQLNGQRIAYACDDNQGSVGRCMIRSKVLTREEINTVVGRVESFLNEGDLDLSVLIETIKPFMQCLASGTYRVQVHRVDEISIVEYNSNDHLNEMIHTYPLDLTIYCTQPVDTLDQERVTYYEDLIRQGKRPAVLLLNCNWSDSFLIDGHHKLKAYANLGLTREAILIDVVPFSMPVARYEETNELNQSTDGLF